MCDAAMKRIKREVEDFYGADAVSVAAPAAAAKRGRSRTVKPEVKAQTEAIKAQLKAEGKPATAVNIARARSASRRSKMSPQSEKLNSERMMVEANYRKALVKLKRDPSDKAAEDAKKEATDKLKNIRKRIAAHEESKKTQGGRRRSRRASRKSRRASRKNRKSRRASRKSYRRRH
jgi:hypothetical protein